MLRRTHNTNMCIQCTYLLQMVASKFPLFIILTYRSIEFLNKCYENILIWERDEGKTTRKEQLRHPIIGSLQALKC